VVLQSVLVVLDGKGNTLQMSARAYGYSQRDFVEYRQHIDKLSLVSAQYFFYMADYVVFFVHMDIITVRLQIIEIPKRTAWR